MHKGSGERSSARRYSPSAAGTRISWERFSADQLIRAGMAGIARDMQLPMAADLNLYAAPAEVQAQYQKLPETLKAAKAAAAGSAFIAASLPEAVIRHYTR